MSSSNQNTNISHPNTKYRDEELVAPGFKPDYCQMVWKKSLGTYFPTEDEKKTIPVCPANPLNLKDDQNQNHQYQNIPEDFQPNDCQKLWKELYGTYFPTEQQKAKVGLCNPDYNQQAKEQIEDIKAQEQLIKKHEKENEPGLAQKAYEAVFGSSTPKEDMKNASDKISDTVIGSENKNY